MARSLDLEVRSLTIDSDVGSDRGVILEAEGTVSASDLLAVWVAGPASVAVIFPDEAPDAGATDGDRRRALQQALRIEHRDAETRVGFFRCRVEFLGVSAGEKSGRSSGEECGLGAHASRRLYPG